jgi:hypothetical protein
VKLTKSREELRSRIERVVARMPEEQVVQELAARIDEPLRGSGRHVGQIPVEDFIESCLIVEKEGETEVGLIPFRMWPDQRAALEVIERERFLVVPKGRQIGITWLELAAMLHAGIVGGNRLFNIARQSGDDAKDAIRRLLILMGYDANTAPPHMAVLPESPAEMSTWRPTIVGKTTTSITLENGSRFQTKTATRHIARGDAAFWTLCDEFAAWPWPRAQLAALEHGAHRVHVVSTGDGDADDFATLFKVAERSKGKWRSHFVPATADPRRSAEWFRQNVDEAADPDLAARELARDITDVFRPREGAFFKCFKRAQNVREFDVVPNWPTETCVDFGLGHPAALCLQISPSGQPFVFDEHLPDDEPKTSDFGQGLLDLLASYKLQLPVRGPYSDPAGKSRNVQTKRSEFAVFRDLGMRPEGKPSKVNDGVVIMVESIGDPDPGRRLIIHQRCTGLIAALSNVQAHRNDDDIYDKDHKVYSHPLDALRYWHICRYGKRSGGGAVAYAEAPPRRTGF